MRYVVDLHSHSGYAGGVGNISLDMLANTMKKKGINAFGSGDCLQPKWNEKLKNILIEKEKGLFALEEHTNKNARFVLQTEIIITSPVNSGGRKGTHVVMTFPNFQTTNEVSKLFKKWNVKIDIGRPFLKCESKNDVAEKLYEIKKIDPLIMVIPAHVLTPQGIYGSDHPVDSMEEVFGEFTKEIKIVETGISSDPELLALIPELDQVSFISNSDCHSEALNRVGREFTVLEINKPSYQDIVEALRQRNIRYTAEFNPAEGRYFLTGHKAGLQGHGKEYCYFSPDKTPQNRICPICKKKLTVGVLERALHLSMVQSKDKKIRDFKNLVTTQKTIAMVPLVEVIAAGLGVKNVSSNKINNIFELIIKYAGTESELWELTTNEIITEFTGILTDRVLETIIKVHKGEFSFQPGYDGAYGKLVIGKKISWFGHEYIHKE